MKEILQDISRTTDLELLEKLNYGYFTARYIEISCILDLLLDKEVLQKENFTSKPLVDLGTGSGIGLLALRNFTNKQLMGVDYDSHFSDWRNDYAGAYEIPTKELISKAQASFIKQDMIVYLKELPNESISLATAFYMSRQGWLKVTPEIYDQFGRVLTLGGQFLLTTDADLIMPRINWANKNTHFRGNEGVHEQTLIFDVPEKFSAKYQNLIPDARCYLENETIKSQGVKIGLIRDRNIQIFTKTSRIKHYPCLNSLINPICKPL